MVIKAVICDLDGTLYACNEFDAEVKKIAIAIIVDQFGVRQNKAKQLLAEAKETCVTLTKSLDHIGVPRQVFYDALSKRLDYSELLMPDLRIKKLLDEIHNLGCKFAIVTNSGRSHALKTVGALGLPINCLDAFVTSSEVEPKISLQPYFRALEILQVTADQVLCVGDRVDVDLKPAKALGMYTVLVSKKRVGSSWVDSRIGSIFVLPALLKRFKKINARANLNL